MAALSSKNRRKFGQKTCAIGFFFIYFMKNAVFSIFGDFSFSVNKNLKLKGHEVARVVQHH
jgi:hypothetical protein